MRSCADERDLVEAFPQARAEAESAFGDASLYLERRISGGRHVAQIGPGILLPHSGANESLRTVAEQRIDLTAAENGSPVRADSEVMTFGNQPAGTAPPAPPASLPPPGPGS